MPSSSHSDTEHATTASEWSDVRPRLARIAAASTTTWIHDAGYDSWVLEPPLSIRELSEIEAQLRVQLPDEYRSFLLQAGRGGAGPYYGVFPLRKVNGQWYWDSDDPNPTDMDRIFEPFPHTEAINPLDIMPVEPKEEDFETTEAFYSALDGWQQQWDKIVGQSSAGLLYLCNLGCALRHAIVVSGPVRGQMWADRLVDGAGYEPLFDDDGTPLTFTRWYKRWLDGVEREIGITTFPDSITHCCQYCQKVVVNEDYDFEMWDDVDKNEFLNIHLGATLADLMDSSREGCDLAQYLLKEAKSVEKSDCPEKLMLSAAYRNYMDDKDKGHPDHILTLALWNTETRSIAERLIPMFGICTPRENPAARRIATRPISVNPFSDDTLKAVYDWLEECLDCHSSCNEDQTKVMPRRLVHIAKDDGNWKLHLLDPVDKPVTYTALSYCWGSLESMTAKTTKGTLSSWAIDIPWQQLPRTLQDAITVSYKLGIRFLWVDAFCIIQDNEDDMQREISLMPNIYSQAFITIVVSCAESVQEGFLQDRVITENIEKVFKVPFRCDNWETGGAFLVEARRIFLEEPLDVRGWAMQERLLARRVLEFGTRQTRWMCKGDIHGRCDGWTPYVESSVQRHDYLPEMMFLPRMRVSKNRSNLDRIYSDWKSLLCSFTHRQLTIESDRILAIAGLAEKYSIFFPGRYLAGIWNFWLPYDLLWLVEASARVDKPQKYQAPSWSWAAVNGPISFFGYYPYKNITKLNSGVRILSIDIQLASYMAPFGAVLYGILTLKGRIQPAEWKQESKLGVHGDRVRIPGIEGQSGLLALRVASDYIENESVRSSWTPCFLLYLVGKPRRKPNEYYGLLLKEEGNDLYSRLGRFCFQREYDPAYCRGETKEVWLDRFEFQSTWFDDCEMRIIDLI